MAQTCLNPRYTHCNRVLKGPGLCLSKFSTQRKNCLLLVDVNWTIKQLYQIRTCSLCFSFLLLGWCVALIRLMKTCLNVIGNSHLSFATMVGVLALRSGLRTAVQRGAAIKQQRSIRITSPVALAQGFEKKVLKEGTGAQPTRGQKVRRHAAYIEVVKLRHANIFWSANGLIRQNTAYTFSNDIAI